MTIWSELGVFLPFLYAFFFSMKSELWILASHIWPADIMDYGHIKQSLGLYFRSAHVSEPSEEITHRSFTESLLCYKTINPFCKWLIQHLTLYWEYSAPATIYAHFYPPKSLIRSAFKTSNMYEYQEITMYINSNFPILTNKWDNS